MRKKKKKPAPKVILWVAFWLSLLIMVTMIIPGLLVKKIPSHSANTQPIKETGKAAQTAEAKPPLMIPV
jgi:stage II sporulation protein D